MIKLPISETAIKFYEEIGYKFSYKEQAHLYYNYIPGLLERNDALRELLKVSDDQELNKDIKMLIEYGSGIYNMFMDNKDNKCIYYLVTLPNDGYCRKTIFKSIEGAKEYVRQYVFTNYKINKMWLMDDCNLNDTEYRSELVFERGDPDIIIDYTSAEYEYDYDPSEHGPFEERFDNMFMNVDCPFELGDIVVDPKSYYPVIVLSDRNIFHDRYEKVKSLDWNDTIMELDLEDNLIPVLDFEDDFSIRYVRPFDLEKFVLGSEFTEDFCKDLSFVSKMVKSRFNLDIIKREMGYIRRNWRN